MSKIKPIDVRTCSDHIHFELQNWSRWCWLGAWPHPLPKQQCVSLEGNYRRFGDDSTTESVDDKPIPVCEENARRVQAVYDTLPHVAQQVLRAEYPQRRESGRAEHGVAAAARWLGMRASEYEAALSAAIYRVEQAIGGK